MNAQDSKGRNSLLHSIAFERQPDIVADDQDAGETLTITTTQEEDSICMLLLNHYFEALHQHINDADVEIRETPLILAASKGLVHVVSRLIQLGASTGSRNVVGTTPLLAAVSRLDHSPQSSSYYSLDREKRMVAVIRILVGRIVFEAKEYVSSTNTTTTITPTTSPDAVEDIHKALCGLLYADQRKGITPLMTAAKKGNVEVVRLLVTAMRESLDEFLPRNNQHHLNDVQSVMSTWVDSREYDGGRTALILASMQYAGARSDVIKHLLEAGANPNAQDFFGSTALMWVVSSCNRPSVRTEVMDVLKLLIETGKADVNVVDDRGQTVLHIASKMKLGSIFQYLAEFKTIKPLEEEENE